MVSKYVKPSGEKSGAEAQGQGDVAVTETEWLTSDDPESMYQVIAPQTPWRSAWSYSPETQRQRAFFGAACCRLVWPLLAADDRLPPMVEALENQFDRPLSEEEHTRISADVKAAARYPSEGTPSPQRIAANLVNDAGAYGIIEIRYLLHSLGEWGDVKERKAEIAAILRDIYGNPFRPVVADPRWLTATVRDLAAAIYADRAFDRLPILADTLEDAGCDNADVLAHCRSDGPHVRGCWVVDLILGKK